MTVTIKQTSRTVVPCSRALFVSCSFMYLSLSSIADDDFGGLHAFGIDFCAEDFPRTFPTQINEFADRCVIGSGIEIEGPGHGIALTNMEIQIITLGQQNVGGAGFDPNQLPVGRGPKERESVGVEVGKYQF